jgi:hypothetical protein
VVIWLASSRYVTNACSEEHYLRALSYHGCISQVHVAQIGVTYVPIISRVTVAQGDCLEYVRQRTGLRLHTSLLLGLADSRLHKVAHDITNGNESMQSHRGPFNVALVADEFGKTLCTYDVKYYSKPSWLTHLSPLGKVSKTRS